MAQNTPVKSPSKTTVKPLSKTLEPITTRKVMPPVTSRAPIGQSVGQTVGQTESVPINARAKNKDLRLKTKKEEETRARESFKSLSLID